MKAYVGAMVNAKIDEKLENEPTDPDQLLKRPKADIPLKEGWILKEGAVRKNWKKRFFVVNPNWTIDYFTDESRKKKKGTVESIGYSVHTDLDGELIKRAKKVAELMGMDVEKIPKPKSYPEGAFEVYHSRRRCWYLQAETPEERDAWIEVFKTACRKCPSLTKDDKLHHKAFPKAARELRWSLGRCWVPRGTEEQVLTDVISDEVEYAVMGDVYAKLRKLPSMAQKTARNKAQKAVQSMVGAAVKPAWAAAYKAVEEVKPKMEPKVEESVGPIAEQKASMREQIKEKCQAKIDPVLTEKCAPHTAKLCKIVQPDTEKALEKTKEAVVKSLDEYIKQADAADYTKGMADLDKKGVRGYDVWDARREMRNMYDNLWVLREIFSDIRPWQVIYTGEDHCKALYSNALWTFHALVKAQAGEGTAVDAAALEKCKADALAKLDHDAEKVRRSFIVEAMLLVLSPPISIAVKPLVKTLLEPLQALIPDAMSDFLNVEDEFDILLEALIVAQIQAAVGGGNAAPPPKRGHSTSLAASMDQNESGYIAPEESTATTTETAPSPLAEGTTAAADSDDEGAGAGTITDAADALVVEAAKAEGGDETAGDDLDWGDIGDAVKAAQ